MTETETPTYVWVGTWYDRTGEDISETAGSLGAWLTLDQALLFEYLAQVTDRDAWNDAEAEVPEEAVPWTPPRRYTTTIDGNPTSEPVEVVFYDEYEQVGTRYTRCQLPTPI